MPQTIWLGVGKQFLVANEFVFPVAIAAGEIASRAPTADIQPAHIVRISVEGNAKTDLEDVSAASALSDIDFGLVEVVIRIRHAEFAVAGLTESDGYTSVLVKAELEGCGAAVAAGISEVLSDVAIQFTIADEFVANVSL